MRPWDYTEMKKMIHSQGLTIKLVSAYMRISPSTFKRRFDKSAVDVDDINHFNDCVKMALNDRRHWDKHYWDF